MCDGMVAFQTRALSSSPSSPSSPAHRLAASTLLLLFILLPHGHASGKTRTFVLCLCSHLIHITSAAIFVVSWELIGVTFPSSCRSVRLDWLPLPLVSRSGCFALELLLRAHSHILCESIHCPNESQQLPSTIE